MAYTRADIRNLVRDSVDPSSTLYANSVLDGWIADAVIEVSPILPVKLTHSETLTGDAVTPAGRISRVMSVKVGSSYWKAMHRAETAFATGYYHIEHNTDNTEIILGATQTAVSVEVVYYAPTTQTDSDSANFALADDYAAMIVLLVIAWAYTSIYLNALISGDSLTYISRQVVIQKGYQNEYYLALADALEESELSIMEYAKK